jgi:hypothetical protein
VRPNDEREKIKLKYRYSVLVRCGCTGEDGKQLGKACPALWRKDGKTWNSRHGSAGYAIRIATSSGTRLVKKLGYTSKAGAEAAAVQVGRLLDLAARCQPSRMSGAGSAWGRHRMGPA